MASDDIGNTGWRPGWYKACNYSSTVLIVMKLNWSMFLNLYTMSCIYTLEVTPAISSGIFQVISLCVCVYMPCHMHSPFSIRQQFPVQKQVHPGSGCGPVE